MGWSKKSYWKRFWHKTNLHDKYLKTSSLKEDVIKTNIHDDGRPLEKTSCIVHSTILIDSIFRSGWSLFLNNQGTNCKKIYNWRFDWY